jgi:Holliday junction resolvase RusA-like endonuclease
MIRITIPGKPVAKKRPRFARIGKGVRTYSDQGTDEGRFLLHLMQQVKQPLEGPLWVEMIFCLPRPKGHFGSGRNAGTLKASAPRYPTSKPDLDNLEKFAMDCCNGVAWKDDAQVVRSSSAKVFGDNPATVIQVKEAPPA